MSKLDALVEEVVNDPVISGLFDHIEEGLAQEREAFREDLLKALAPLGDRYKPWIIYHVLLMEVTHYLRANLTVGGARDLLKMWIETRLPSDGNS